MKGYESVSIGLVKFGPCFDKFFGNLQLILETYALSFYWSKTDFNQDLRYGFCKKLLRYKWTSDQLNTFFLTFWLVCCVTSQKVRKKVYRSNFLQNPYFSQLFGPKVHSDLFSYLIHMTLNVIGSFDVKKWTLTIPFIEFIFFKINFFVFCTKK